VWCSICQCVKQSSWIWEIAKKERIEGVYRVSHREKEKNYYAGSKTLPASIQGKGDTLARSALSLPHQKSKPLDRERIEGNLPVRSAVPSLCSRWDSTLAYITSSINSVPRVTKVTRMAYSPRLWLMAIGWWNRINQCRKLKLDLTQTWGVCMSLDSKMHWSQSVILWWQAKKGITSELEGANARRVLKLNDTIRNYFRTATKTAQNFLRKYLSSGSRLLANLWLAELVGFKGPARSTPHLLLK